MTATPGNYSQVPSIDWGTLYSCITSLDKASNNAIHYKKVVAITVVAGTIATIALAIFAPLTFAIIAGVSTIALTAYFTFDIITNKNKSQSIQNTLNRFRIAKTFRAIIGDTYDDKLLGDLYKVTSTANNNKVTFYNVFGPVGDQEMYPFYQRHVTKSWENEGL